MLSQTNTDKRKSRPSHNPRCRWHPSMMPCITLSNHQLRFVTSSFIYCISELVFLQHSTRVNHIVKSVDHTSKHFALATPIFDPQDCVINMLENNNFTNNYMWTKPDMTPSSLAFLEDLQQRHLKCSPM
jgi:hypothetical protein